MKTLLPPSLIQAYRATAYRVLGEHGMVLRIDTPSALLARLHAALGVNCSAFITACNPRSQATDAAINLEWQARLAAELMAGGWVPVDAVGEDPTGRWQGEPSFLVPGMSQQEARETGIRYAQNAVVWSGADAMPRLILLR
jgi:hypothetical protein